MRLNRWQINLLKSIRRVILEPENYSLINFKEIILRKIDQFVNIIRKCLKY